MVVKTKLFIEYENLIKKRKSFIVLGNLASKMYETTDQLINYTLLLILP